MKHDVKRKALAVMLAGALLLTGAYVPASQAEAAKKVTLKLSKTSLSLKKGESVTLKLTKKNVKIKSKTWSSSKKSVAAVTKKGKVTAKGAGKAKISLKVKYIAAGKKKTETKTLKCKVTVTKKAAATPSPSPAPVPGSTVLDKILAPEDIPFRVKWDDTSNIGTEKELILGDTTMKMKDNGTMRKELSAQYLADNEMGEGINLGNTIEATYSLPEKKVILNNGSVAFCSNETMDPESFLYVSFQALDDLYEHDKDAGKTVAKNADAVPVFSDVRLKVTDTNKTEALLYDKEISWNPGSDGDCRIEVFREMRQADAEKEKKTPTVMPEDLKALSFTEMEITFTVNGIEKALKEAGKDKVTARIKGRTDKVLFSGKGEEVVTITKDGTYTVRCKTPITCTPEDTQFDSAWSNAPTTQAYIDRLHSYGINTLRIPVAWTNGDSDDGTFTIDQRLLDRVERVVNYALNNGMYVIINDHWDNQWWGEFGACKKIDKLDENGNPMMKNGKVQQERIPDEEWRQKAWTRYERYWTQIAERFKNYSDHLIFEGANEELCNRLNDEIYPSTGYCQTLTEGEKKVSGNLTETELYDMSNRINQKFVDIIRGTGGNNAYRHLLIPGYGTNIEDTCNDAWKMPVDIEENGKNKLFVSVHYYTPWGFCGDGGTNDYKVSDQRSLPYNFEPLKKFSEDGYAIILGECGICNPTGVKASVTQWFLDTLTEAAKYHMVPCAWETGQYFNRKEATLKFKDIAEFYNTVCQAAGDTGMTRTTGYQEIKSVDVSKMTPVWSFEGRWYKNGGDFLVGDDKFTNPEGAVQINSNSAMAKDFATGTIKDTITGDATEIYFDSAGYQSYINIDREKIKDPIVRVTFLPGTETDDKGEDSVGMMQLGATEEAGSFVQDALVSADEVRKGGIRLSDIGSLYLLDSTPWLCLTFTQKPIVTGIYIYDGAQP